MGAYTIEQQKLDLAILDETKMALSARLIGEKQALLESYVVDYVRIARMWANKPHLNPGMVKQSARMFKELAYAPRISAWQLAEYGPLLTQTRKMIRDSLFRRKKKSQTCAEPEIHPQKCYCLNLQKSKERQASFELEKAILQDVIGEAIKAE